VVAVVAQVSRFGLEAAAAESMLVVAVAPNKVDQSEKAHWEWSQVVSEKLVKDMLEIPHVAGGEAGRHPDMRTHKEKALVRVRGHRDSESTQVRCKQKLLLPFGTGAR